MHSFFWALSHSQTFANYFVAVFWAVIVLMLMLTAHTNRALAVFLSVLSGAAILFVFIGHAMLLN